MPTLQGKRRNGGGRAHRLDNAGSSRANDRRDDDGPPPSDGEDGVDSELDEEEEDTMEVDRDVSGEGQLVTKLVRYALACEYSRTPIRRDALREKVLGSQGRSFKKIFLGAQAQLRTVFGMEMVEQPSRDRSTMTTEERRKAAKSQSQGPSSTNSYALVSTLPAPYREAGIIAPSRIQSPDEEAAYVALYTTIVSIITLSGGQLSDARLQRHLQRLNVKVNMPMGKTEDALARMVRQGYLGKARSKAVAGGGDEDSLTWFVGPRGRLEVTPEAIAAFVREAYQGTSADLEKRLEASLKIKPKAVPGADEKDEVNGSESDRQEPRRSRRGRLNREESEGDDEDDDEQSVTPV